LPLLAAAIDASLWRPSHGRIDPAASPDAGI